MTVPFPEPTDLVASRADVLLGYLDYFRSTIAVRIRGLDAEALGASVLPSGWTPLQLLNHLTNVERRWLEWGFEGESVDDPWADSRDDRWWVDPELSADDLLVAFGTRARRTREIVLRHDLDEYGAPSERWAGQPPPTLERVLLHLIQEFARHAGHLDVVAELAGGPTGE